MDEPELTRRRYLAGAGVAASASLAGCSLFSSPTYDLSSRPKSGSDPVELFRWKPNSDPFHVDDETAEAYIDSLVADLHSGGQIETLEDSPVPESGSAQGGFAPVYTVRDGRYDRVRARTEPATVERWVVWMEPLEEIPSGKDAVDIEYDSVEPSMGFSDVDREILTRVSSAVELSVIEDEDHASLPATERGLVFFDPYDPAESDMVPEPPFDYAVVEPDSEFRSEDIPVRLHVEEEAVETTRYVCELERVAESRDEFVTHVETEHVVASFSTAELVEKKLTVLQQSTGTRGYEEETPLSTDFEAILGHLELDDVSLPDDREVASWHRYYVLDDSYYMTEMRIADTTLL